MKGRIILAFITLGLFTLNVIASDEIKEKNQKQSIGDKLSEGYEVLKEKSVELKENVAKELDRNKKRREEKNWGVHFNYTYIDTWVPGKTGVNLYYVESAAISWDLEYLKGSLSVPAFIFDIGEFTDERASLLKRSFGNKTSFHFFYGAYYNHLNIHLGDKLLESVSGNSSHSVEVMDVKLMGLSWGFGNRWQTSRKFTWGIDWLTINMPLVRLGADTPYLDKSTDSGDKEDARDALETLQTYPTFSILKLQFGMSW